MILNFGKDHLSCQKTAQFRLTPFSHAALGDVAKHLRVYRETKTITAAD
jgi:hypothetical protein